MFDQFWSLYPRRVAKKDAFKAWSKLTEEQKKKALEEIPKHSKCWCAECRQPHYIPLAATWINGWRFEDELQEPEPELKSSANVVQFAKQKHIEARPGESMEEFTQRVRQSR